MNTSSLLIPVLAEEMGASDIEIGVIGTAYGICYLLSTYVFGLAADSYGRAMLLKFGLGLSSLAMFLQVFAFDPSSLALSRAFVGFALGIYPSALIAYVHESGGKLGWFTSYGSLGFGVGTLLAGILSVFWQTFMLSSALFVVSYLITLTLPAIKETKTKLTLFPKAVMKRNSAVYLSFLMRHTGATGIWLIYPLFLHDFGASYFMIGVIYAVNSVTQFFCMGLLDKYRANNLVLLGLVLSAISFFAMPHTVALHQVLPIQVAIGASWSMLYVGSLRSVMDSGAEKSTSSGMLSSVIGLSGVLGPLFGGVLSELYGYTTTMYLGGIMTIGGLLVYLSIDRNVLPSIHADKRAV